MEFFEFKYFDSDFYRWNRKSHMFCECNKIDERNIENRIEIDRSEAEKYEFIHESCVFS